MYVVLLLGVTDAEPEVAPPVEKFTPELEDELTQDHVMLQEEPWFTILKNLNHKT